MDLIWLDAHWQWYHQARWSLLLHLLLIITSFWSHVLAKSWAQRKGVDCCILNQPRSLKSQKIEIQNMKTSAENMEFDLMMASGQMVVNI